MSKQFVMNGYVIRLGKPFFSRISLKESVYDDHIMVVVPFTLYNSNNVAGNVGGDCYSIYYDKKEYDGTKADFAFKDSLANMSANPRQTVYGYIRMPYRGYGFYSVVFRGTNLRQVRRYEWLIKLAPCQVIVNNACTSWPVIGVPGSADEKQRLDSLQELKFVPFLNDDPAIDYERKKVEFGHGRKRSREWNDEIARSFGAELRNLKMQRAADPNLFDHQAMK